MDTLTAIAPAFVEMAHRIVWCTATTVDAQGRPRSRILQQVENGVAVRCAVLKRCWRARMARHGYAEVA